MAAATRRGAQAMLNTGVLPPPRRAAAAPARDAGAAAPATPLRLHLARPAPRWQQQVADALAAVVAAQPDADSARTAPIQIALCDSGAARLAGPGPHWLLLDGEGRMLHPTRPLRRALSRGHGVALQLWQRDDALTPWRRLRTLHAGADTRAAQALPRLAQAAAQLLQQALVDRALGNPPHDGALPAPRPPPPAQPLRSWLRGLTGAVAARLRAQLLTEAWRIGIVEMPVARWLQALRAGQRVPVRWLHSADGARCDADPMGVPGNPDVLLCESFDERSGLGAIDRLVLGPQRELLRRDRLPLGGGQHVSFPMMVEIDGRRLGIVESSARAECVLHEVDAQGRWKPLATLLQGQRVADPALFRHDGRWWLAVTDLDIGPDDNLCLYHAEAAEGPWLAHANNPVKLDVGSARMAGPLFRLAQQDGAALVRPGQDCRGSYGSAVVLHRITELSPTRFAETPIVRITPEQLAPGRHARLSGTHTVCPWGDVTLIDAKRHVMHRGALWRKLRQRLGR